MKPQNLVQKVLKYLNNQSIDIRVRMMYFLEYAVLIACATGTICMILLNQPVHSMLPNIGLFVLSFIGLYISHVKKNYGLASFILILGCANITVPWMFFTAGGNKSGMHIWFVFSIVVTCMMSVGKIRIFMSAITIVEDLACICIAQFFPEFVTPLIGENAEFYDQFQSFAVCCASLTVMLIIYIATYDKQRLQLQAQSEELLKLMQTDALTGVYNRRAYYDEMNVYKNGEEIEDLFLVSLDVNGLKRVNDSMGHAAGDNYLCEASKVISQALGQYGHVFRTGGDEFMAIVRCSAEEAKKFETKINESIASLESPWAEKMAIAVGTVGFAEIADFDIAEIEKLADKRMYENKALYYRRSGIDRRM